MKPTQATIRQRVEELLSIRLEGATFVDARRYVAEKEAEGVAPWTIPEGGKPVSERIVVAFHYAGFVFILGLMLFVFSLEIQRGLHWLNLFNS